MDGVVEHDVVNATGLSEEEAAKVYEISSRAISVYAKNHQKFGNQGGKKTVNLEHFSGKDVIVTLSNGEVLTEHLSSEISPNPFTGVPRCTYYLKKYPYKVNGECIVYLSNRRLYDIIDIKELKPAKVKGDTKASEILSVSIKINTK